jgi:hypothetical protein
MSTVASSLHSERSRLISPAPSSSRSCNGRSEALFGVPLRFRRDNHGTAGARAEQDVSCHAAGAMTHGHPAASKAGRR